MPSFMHAADLHLDSPLKGLEAYEGAPDIEEIRGATRQALINLVEYTLNEQVPLVLFAGDLYDGDWPDFGTGLFFSQQMQRLSQAGVQVAMVCGNHDAQNKMTKSLVMPDNFKILSARKPETIIYKDIDIAVHGQSYAMAETTQNLAADYPQPQGGMLNIGLLHCLISGTTGHQPYAPCALDELAAKGYDYWALGHVHEYKVLRDSPMIVYPGCCQGRHVKEAGPKGCVHVEYENGLLSCEFVRLDSVQWRVVSADISGADTMAQAADVFAHALETQLADSDGRLCCVRALLKGRTSLHGKLAVDPAELTANMRAIAADVSRQRVWIETVRIGTGTQLDLAALAQSDTPQGELLRYMQAMDSVAEIDVDFTVLRSKLAGSGIDVPMADDPEILNGAKDILISLLTDADTGESSS
jgi:hypothetical protein